MATTERPVPGVRFDWVLGTGWVHSHGMDRYGLPELEVRNVPDFLAEAAARLLRHVCNYMLDSGRTVRAEETMATSPNTRFRFVRPEPMPGMESHYETERLQIVDVEGVCGCCGGPGGEPGGSGPPKEPWSEVPGRGQGDRDREGTRDQEGEA